MTSHQRKLLGPGLIILCGTIFLWSPGLRNRSQSLRTSDARAPDDAGRLLSRSASLDAETATATRPIDNPQVRRTKELMEFPNPAAEKILVVVEQYAPAGWIHTTLFEEASMYCCLLTQLRRWEREDSANTLALARTLEQDHSAPPEVAASLRRIKPGQQWTGLEPFYTTVFSNRFAGRFGILDNGFMDELGRISYDSPTPNFRR